MTDSRRGLPACCSASASISISRLEDIPPDLRDKATSVLIATGRPATGSRLAGELFNRLDTRYMETRGRAASPRFGPHGSAIRR